MRLIKPSFSIWDQQEGLEGIYKQIERAGRVCYKSEDKITEDSAKDFIEDKLRGKKDAWRRYHCGYYTGKTWIHENTGETYREAFTYELSKA